MTTNPADKFQKVTAMSTTLPRDERIALIKLLALGLGERLYTKEDVTNVAAEAVIQDRQARTPKYSESGLVVAGHEVR